MGSVLSAPEGYTLTDKEIDLCKIISEPYAQARLPKEIQIFQIVAAEIAVHLRKLDSKEEFIRVLRQLILIHGAISFNKIPDNSLVHCGACFPGVANYDNLRVYPNHSWSIREIRSIGNGDNSTVSISYIAHGQEEVLIQYQTPHPERFVLPLSTQVVANYAGVPTWAVPIRWDLNLPIQTISNQIMETALGNDGGFATAVSGLINVWMLRRVQTEKKKTVVPKSPADVAAAIQAQQPYPLVPELAVADCINVGKLFLALTEEKTISAYLLCHILQCLPFNLFYRTLKVKHIKIRDRDSTTNLHFKIALCQIFLYNVTLRDIDLEGTNLRGFGEDLGQALAMNIQPLICRMNLASCNLDSDDVLGLLPGLARTWCGGSAILEAVNITNNISVNTDVWQTLWRAIAEPSTWPNWPSAPPPVPCLSFLQHLDLRNTSAMGPGFALLLSKLENLRSLSVSGDGEGVETCMQALAESTCPLKSFYGLNMASSNLFKALSAHTATLQEVTLENLSGLAAEFLVDWPHDAPKLAVVFKGSSQNAIVTGPTTNVGFAPGSLTLENTIGHYFSRGVLTVLAQRATGLRALYLSGVPLTDLGSIAPILATCGLVILHASMPGDYKEQYNKLENRSNCDAFWLGLAPSKTLYELNLPNQLSDVCDSLQSVGMFLKTNRSVRIMSFDSTRYTMSIDGVKALRKAFYGNKKVVSMAPLKECKLRALERLERITKESLRKVATEKAQIKALYKAAYSKYNRNWRNGPNRDKIPHVERICVAKRQMGAATREMKKMGELLIEIRDCILVNSAILASEKEAKSKIKLEKRQVKLKKLATKKQKLLVKMVSKIRKAKLRGQNGKSAKKQVPRSTYYKLNMWPNYQVRSHNSHWNMLNDPYGVRQHYEHSCEPSAPVEHEAISSEIVPVQHLQPEVDIVVDLTAANEEDVVVTPAVLGKEDGIVGVPVATKPDEETKVSLPQYCLAFNTGGTQQQNTWTGLVGNDSMVAKPQRRDPWNKFNFTTGTLDWWWRRQYFYNHFYYLHYESVELGPDVTADLALIADLAQEIEDAIADIAEKCDADPEDVGANVAEQALEDFSNTTELCDTLYNVPDFYDKDDTDVMDDGVDGVVDMYGAAGPQDLDDGGPSLGDSNHAAIAGAMRKRATRKQNRDQTRVRCALSRQTSLGYLKFSLPDRDYKPGVSVSSTDRSKMWDEEETRNWNREMNEIRINAMAESGAFPFPDCSCNQPESVLSWKHTSTFECEDNVEITLVTQCSIDRLANLERQLSNWKGRSSIAVYVSSTACLDDAKNAVLQCIRNAELSAQSSRWNASVLLVQGITDDEPYPINYLRNVALLEAERLQRANGSFPDRAAVFLVDVDFRPSDNLHDVLQCKVGSRLLLTKQNVVVIPAFECHPSQILSNVGELWEATKNGFAEGFHLAHFPDGHGPCDYGRFWLETFALGKEPSAQDCCNAAYAVKYRPSFEPYVVIATRAVPLYDERFQGYGLNKVSHLASVARACGSSSFIVLPNVFVVAPEHERSTSWQEIYGKKSDETEFNKLWLKGLYRDFLNRLERGEDPKVSDRTKNHKQALLAPQIESLVFKSHVHKLSFGVTGSAGYSLNAAVKDLLGCAEKLMFSPLDEEERKLEVYGILVELHHILSIDSHLDDETMIDRYWTY